MKTATPESPVYVNPDKELTHIVDYLTKTWEGFDKVDGSAFISTLWQMSVHAHHDQFDDYPFLDILIHINEKYEHSKKVIDGNIKLSDLGMLLMSTSRKLSRDTQYDWDYQKDVNEISAEIFKQFPLANKLRPKGWLKAEKNNAEDMIRDESEKTLSLFKGSSLKIVGAFGFPKRVSLPEVMHYDKGQKIKPLDTLIGAMLAHGYVICKNNNSVDMLKDISSNLEKLEDKTTLKFKHPLNKIIYKNALDLAKEYANEDTVETKKQTKPKH